MSPLKWRAAAAAAGLLLEPAVESRLLVGGQELADFPLQLVLLLFGAWLNRAYLRERISNRGELRRGAPKAEGTGRKPGRQ